MRPLRRLRTPTVGVIGCGHIGSGFAHKVGCLGARVLGFDPARGPEELVHDGALEPADFDELLAQADAISLHAPLTEQTRHLIDLWCGGGFCVRRCCRGHGAIGGTLRRRTRASFWWTRSLSKAFLLDKHRMLLLWNRSYQPSLAITKGEADE